MSKKDHKTGTHATYREFVLIGVLGMVYILSFWFWS